MSNTTTDAPASGWVRGLCWSAVALEGYDLVVLGVVLPVLLRDPAWGLTPASASVVATVGLVGVMVGALSVGPVSDLVGRRRTLVATVVLFSVLSLACAAAVGPTSLAVLRFLAGIGLGGVLPVALATVAEHAPPRRGNAATTIMMTGYHVGAVAAALLGIALIPRLGWPVMFALGAVPALLLAPLMLTHLPRDGGRGRPAGPAAREGANPVRELFRDGRARATIAFWVASFMGLLLVYGLNTWLPEIMRSAGYPLGAALALLLTLNVGAVLGLLVGGPVADRIGVRTATITWFVLGAVFLALLSVRLPGVGVYAIVLLAGIFVFSAQVLVYAWVGRYYPAAARGTALGAASGVGRLGAITGPALGGALLTAGLAYPWGFYAFALVAALGALAVAAVGRGPGATPADAEVPAAPAEGTAS
ncbi:aromatic acid/H+ symport family MFS transporter [Actinomycetospora sp. TBRC 11914]|uniref:MFS transporter n=1 Tax=Actinomycetospora sp. TBRC 11914 TaxID=2729387 RepID=UPI00145EB09C|nr:aromatic acid/H+ symport family MFS transporter [Actinomycetospora sp. TBRC 11914]NMO89325.1 aromatic acid/H+ symport family MFS transporter [Actinomycetospora sp. TBRC 11914]